MLAVSWESIFDVPQAAIIMGCLVPIAWIVGKFWYMARKVASENRLKRTMVEHGMSIDEIERVMAAKQRDK